MNQRIGYALFLCSAVGLSHVVLIVGRVTPYAYRSIYSLQSVQEARVLMPEVTEMAVDHSWVFVLVMALISLVSVVFSHRNPDRLIPVATLGLCGQWLVAWVAFLAFFFEGVSGPMSLHHGSEFEFVEFMRFAMGVFPVTLAAILVPMFAAAKSVLTKD